MNEEQLAYEKAIAKFLEVFRDDILKMVDAGVLPVTYLIAFREPTRDKYENIRYISRCTRDCPPGLERVMEEVLHKWVEETYGELLPGDEMPIYNQ